MLQVIQFLCGYFGSRPTVGVGFEVSYAEATPGVKDHFLLPSGQDGASTMSVFMPLCSAP